MHFEVLVVLIVVEIHIRFTMPTVAEIELISIALRYDVAETIQTISSSIAVLVVEAAPNEGMNLVVVSLINIR